MHDDVPRPPTAPFRVARSTLDRQTPGAFVIIGRYSAACAALNETG